MRKYFSQIILFLFFTVSLTGQDYQVWVDNAARHIEADRLDSAAISLQRAMSLDPVNENNPVLLLNLGIIQRQLGHTDDAYVSFTAALANNPIPEVVLHRRASLLSEMGRYDEAIEDYSSLIERYPEDVEAYYRRGVLYLEQDNRLKGEAAFVKANELDPDHFFTHLSKALLFKLEDNWEAAEKIYTGLIESEPNPDPSILLNRAECYVHTGQTFRASADLRTAEPSQRDNPYFYFLRGRVRLDQFDKVAARADFNKAREMGYDLPLVEEWIDKTK